MKASVIDGFPNEFKQRGFKAGVFFPSEKWNEAWKQNTLFPLNFEKEIFPSIFLKQKDRNLQAASSLSPYLFLFFFHTSEMVDWLRF